MVAEEALGENVVVACRAASEGGLLEAEVLALGLGHVPHGRPLEAAQLHVDEPLEGPQGAAVEPCEADGLEEGAPGARPQVEQVVLRVLDDGLTLVPVVVHVESLAPGVGLAPLGAVGDDAAVAVGEELGRAAANELESGGLFVGESAESASPFCNNATTLR